MIYTIGYGNSKISDFIGELKKKYIGHVVDVRTYPQSRYNPSFSKNRLAQILDGAGIFYSWMGKSLGGLEDVQEDFFLSGINELVNLQKVENLVIMCSEKDYTRCHRYQKITPRLTEKGVAVEHITIGGTGNNTNRSKQKNLMMF